MSSVPNSNNTSLSPDKVRSPNHDLLASNESSVVRQQISEVRPKTLSQIARSKTAPNTLDGPWKKTVKRPQLSERDSIFATTYHTSPSPPSSPKQTPQPESKSNGSHQQDHVPVLEDSQSERVTDTTPTARRQSSRTAQAASSRFRAAAPPSRNKMRIQNGPHELLQSRYPAESRDSPSTILPTKQYNHVRDMNNSQFPLDGQRDLRFAEQDIDEAERARYRSWRVGKATLGVSGLTAKRSRSGDNTHVDKKIQVTLPRMEPPTATARSRKSSQYLGLFKEKDVAAEQKRRAEKIKSKVEGESALIDDLGSLPPLNEKVINDYQFTLKHDNTHLPEIPEPAELVPFQNPSVYQALAHGGPQLRGTTSPALKTLPDVPADPHLRPRTSPVIPSQEISQSTSSRLVQDLRVLHDIDLDSESERFIAKSLASRIADKSGKDSPKTKSPREEREEYFQQESDHSEPRSPESDDDEESEREHISSALYFPHRQIVTEPDCLRERSLSESSEEQPNTSLRGGPDDEFAPTAEERQAEKTKRANEVEISLKSQDETDYLHGDLPTIPVPPSKDISGYVSSHDEAPSDSDYETYDESSRYYGSSSDEESGTTPNQISQQVSSRKESHDSQPSRPPLGAVELKPYKHQVGGHSTMYRFSRRAVCKQLNNRENEFYETVERKHPELLHFLPRYD
jgi:inositol-hexakisphosphate kinase